MADDLELVLRVAVSLGCVLALIWVAGRKVSGGRFSGGAGRTRRSVRTAVPELTVLGRQTLSRRSTLAMVGAGDRTFLLGVSERGISVIAEIGAEQLAAPVAQPGPAREDLDLGELNGLLNGTTQPAGPRRLSAVASASAASTAAIASTAAAMAAAEAAGALGPAAAPVQPLRPAASGGSVLGRALGALQDRTVRR